jgi:hypothetical protein
MFTATMSLLATAKASASSISFDTYGLPFIIDNSATGAICNELSLFVGSFAQQLVSIETAEGTFTKQRNIETLRLVLNGDAGSQHSYDVPGVVDPDSPFILLGIPFLRKFFAKSADTGDIFDDETWILTQATDSRFTWDYGKHERHFQHGDSILPELWLYEGTAYFSAFCSRLRGYLNDKVSYTFSSAFSHPPEINLRRHHSDSPLTSSDALVNEGDDDYGITD